MFRVSSWTIPAALWISAPLVAVEPDAGLRDREVVYEGRAYAADGGELLYLEQHMRYRRGGMARHLVLYRCRDGKPFARKLLVERSDAPAPDFEFEDGRDGYREGVRTVDGRREIFVRPGFGAEEKTRPLPERDDAVIDAGFDAFVLRHWRALGRGEALVASFLLPSRFRFYEVELSGAGEDERDAQPVRHLRMRLDAWYGFALPDVRLTYQRQPPALLEYRGIGSIRDAGGRNHAVRIVFPQASERRPLTPAQLRRAEQVRLVRRCRAT